MSNHKSQTKKATFSGWIGSVLEYYDFFIYATAASLVFPAIFFPKTDPKVGILLSLLTYGVGYVARPIGALVLGQIGDKKGRKHVLILCMFLMGIATMGVGLVPTYDSIGWYAPAILVVLRLIQGFAVAGEISGSSSMIMEHAPFGRRGFFASFTLQGVQAGQILAAAVFLPMAAFMSKEDFASWGWRIPFLLSFIVILVAYYIRREVDETPVFQAAAGAVQKTPIADVFQNNWKDVIRVILCSFMNVTPIVATVFGAAYAVQPIYGIGFSKEMYLWIPVVGNIVAVLIIPFVGNLSDKIGRRIPLIVGAVGSGLLSFGYLYAISIHNAPLAFAMSILMWGIVYQGYNAVFPSFYPEMFPTRTRVTGMAIAQNIGTALTALLPAFFVQLVTPVKCADGVTMCNIVDVPMTIGTIVLGITIISGISAFTARETYRIRMEDLGEKNAVPVPKDEYDAIRAAAIANAK